MPAKGKTVKKASNKEVSKKKATRVITITNNKGGSTKTAVCLNLAGEFARRGLKVLIVDLDMKSCCTYYMTGTKLFKKSIFNVLASDGVISLLDICVPPKNKELWGSVLIAPCTSNIRNLSVSVEALAIENPSFLLEKAIEDTNKYFDIILIDTAGDILTLEATNALVASTDYIIATDTSKLSRLGIPETRVVADEITKKLNKNLRFLGTVLGRYNKPNVESKQASLKALDGPQYGMIGGQKKKVDIKFLSDHIVPDDSKVEEAQEKGVATYQLDPSSPAARAYKKLVDHILLGV